MPNTYSISLYFVLIATTLPAHAATPVLDAKGQPVAGATVECYHDSSAIAAYTGQDFVRKVGTTTDVNGSFTIPASAGVSVAVVKKDGLAVGWRMFGSVLGESSEPVVLTAPTELAGTVVDDNGRPVPDAEVWVSAALAMPEGAPLNQRNMSGLILGKPARDSFSTHTSADGRFRIANFPANSQAELTARKSGMAPRLRANFGNGGLPYTSGQQDIKLTVEPAGNIEGKVTVQGSGQPLSGVKVRWLGSGVGLSGLDVGDPVVSSADGSFRMTDVPVGRAAITAVFPGDPLPDWVAENVSVTVTAGETKKGADIHASKGGVAAVAVLSRNDRKPLADAAVAAYNQTAQSSASAVTGADGVARLRLSADDWNISVNKEGWSGGQSSVTVATGQTNRVEIELNAGLKITGTVRDPDGKPVAGANMSVSPNSGNNREVKTDASGHYEIAWQMINYGGNQSYSLMARHAERNLAVSQDIDESTSNLDLKLQPAITLIAKVEDAKGKPVTNATGNAYIVSTSGGWGGTGQSATADAQGRLEISAMPKADGYSLSVTAKGYGSAQQQMQTSARPTNRIEFSTIVLPLANLKLAGKVVGADGKPVAGIMVQFFGQHQPNGNTQTDAQGHFAFDAVCEGPIQLNANSQGAYGNAQTVGGDTNVVLNLAQNNNTVRVAGASAGAKITGTVRDASGKPAAGVRVRVMSSYGFGNEVRTDSEGRYSTTWQQQNYGGMQMTPFIFARDLEHNLAVAGDIDSTTTNMDLNLQPGLTLAVKVEDVNGKPIPAATETLFMWAGNMGLTLSQLPSKADDNGLIEIKSLPQERHYSATITAKGYGSANLQAQPGDTKTSRFEFPTAVLHVADRKLAGEVLGPDSKPVSGASVSLNGQGQPSGNTTTDAKGHFSFDAVCEGPVQLFANSQGIGGAYSSGNTQAQGGDTNVVIRFGVNGQARGANAQMVTTSGKVFDPSGAPVSGVRLSVAGTLGPNAEVRSDSDGKYSIAWQFQNVGAQGAAAGRRGGAPVSQTLLVGRDVAHNLAAAVELTDKSTSVDLHLQPGLTLSGSVEDPDGAPVKNATVQLNLMTARRSSMIGQQQPTTVDADGAYSLSALPQGQQYTVFVNANGYGSANRQVPVAETQTASFHLPPFRLKLANQKLEGQVVNANDKPVSGAQVQINGTGQPTDSTTTDSKGHFVFNHVCEGALRVFAYDQFSTGNGILQSGTIQAQGGDLNVVVKLGANQGVTTAATRQAPPRATAPKPQIWAWITLRNWPQEHKTAVVVLLGAQAAALLATAGALFWITRRKGG